MNRLFALFLCLFLTLSTALGTVTNCTFTAANGTDQFSYSTGGESTFTRNTSVGGAGGAVINSNRLYATNTSGSIGYISNYTPGSADYFAACDVNFISFPNSTAHNMGIGVRAGTAAFTGYYALVQSQTGGTSIKVTLNRAGNGTPLGTFTATSATTPALPATNDIYRLMVGTVGGNTPTVYVYFYKIGLKPSLLFSITPAGADIITATGVVGTYVVGATGAGSGVGFQIDNLTGNDSVQTITASSSNLWDNNPAYTGATNPNFSSYCSQHFITDAQFISVTGKSGIFSTFPQYAALGARYDGGNNSVLSFTANATTQSLAVPVSGITSTYEIISGGQARPSGVGTVLETSFYSTVVWGSTTLTTLTQDANIPKLLVIGDSVTVGQQGATLFAGNWLQTRYLSGVDVVFEAWGSRAFFDDCPDAATTTTFAAAMAAINPAILVIELQGNDFLRPACSAATYQTRLADFIDKFIILVPGCRIYLRGCITLPVGEGNNSFGAGNSLPDYRTTMSTIASTRGPRVSFIAGSQNLMPLDLSLYFTDNVHPLDAGQRILGGNMRRELGFITRMNTTAGAVTPTGITAVKP